MMALVLVVALDAGAYKALLGGPPPAPVALIELIVVGALPMANVLALGLYPILMPRHRHERGRPGWVGFEVGGLAALLFYLACSLTMTHPLHQGVAHLLRALGFVPGKVFLAGAVVLLLLPQLALALLGGWLCRTSRFRVSAIVERRSPSGAEPEPAPERRVVAERS
jgi:hypothetical protein